MRVFVTGGTGLLGNTVIRQLCEEDHQVVAMVRDTPEPEVFAGLDVDFVYSDLVPDNLGSSETGSNETGQAEEGAPTPSDDPPMPADELPASSEQQPVLSDDAVDQAIADCDAVIHAAGLIHLGWKRLDESMRVNRDGTLRIIRSCQKHGRKLIYIGTVNAIAVGSRRMNADENTPLGHAGGQVECAYVRSKRASLALIRQAVTQGLNATVVHPGFMLGPWDWKPSSGRMMLEVGKGWKPIAPSGGCSLCDSRDVAAGVITAMKKSTGNPGREFIMAGYNWTYEKLWTEMANRMGTRPPIRAAGPGMEYLAGLAGDFWTRVTGKESDVNSAGVAMSGQFHWYSSGRAEKELGYRNRDAEETLDAAGQWIRDRFVLPATAAAS